MELPDLTTLMLSGQVSEVDADRVKVGQEVEITVDAIPNQVFGGKITQLGKIFNRVSFGRPGRVLRVNIEFDQIETERMRPRMAARFQVVSQRLRNVLAVPLATIHVSDGGNPYVWVKGEQGPERRPVQIGATNELVSVIVAGLEEGEEIASRILSEVAEEEMAP